MSSNTLLLDGIAHKILSYTKNDYLFTGTVCKKWNKCYNNLPKTTDTKRVVMSVSRIEESETLMIIPLPKSTFFYSVAGRLMDFASRYGNFDVMVWLKDRGFPLNSLTLEFAAENGSLANMKWLREQGCPWDSTTFIAAAKHGNLDNMKWLKHQDCPWDEKHVYCSGKTW